MKLSEISSSQFTTELVAQALNGRELGFCGFLSEAEQKLLGDAGLVVAHGGSDDLAILRGAVDEERDVHGDGLVYVEGFGEISFSYNGDEGIKAGYEEWFIKPRKSDARFSAFDLLDDGEKFCRGIVVSIK